MKLFHTSLLAVMIAVAVLCPATVAAEIDSIAESVSYTIDFPINRHTVDPAFSHNGQALDSLRATIDAIRGDSLVGLEKISVEGYASPDGRVSAIWLWLRGAPMLWPAGLWRSAALSRSWFIVSSRLLHGMIFAARYRKAGCLSRPGYLKYAPMVPIPRRPTYGDAWRASARWTAAECGRTLTRDIFPGLRRSVSVLVMVRRVIPEPEILPESEPGEDASVMTAGEAAVLSSMADGNCIDN